jgi:hypothetical protein
MNPAKPKPETPEQPTQQLEQINHESIPARTVLELFSQKFEIDSPILKAKLPSWAVVTATLTVMAPQIIDTIVWGYLRIFQGR